MFIRFDRMYERDRQTDGQTPHGNIGRAYASHRAAKMPSILADNPLEIRDYPLEKICPVGTPRGEWQHS